MRQFRQSLGRFIARATLTTLVLGPLATGCISRPIEPLDSRTTFTTQSVLPRTNINKIDVLFVVDDSRSMGDKQDVLAQAVPDLVRSLANPSCITSDGQLATTPNDPSTDCPQGSHREFKPIEDIHIAVISTDLGARGGVGCDKSTDHAHPTVLTADGQALPSVDNKGFLAWNPAQTADGYYGDLGALQSDVEKIVRGVGQKGCGLEAPLESWYRFLVDPKPFSSIKLQPDTGQTFAEGEDVDLIAQREAFLRPDSLVAIVMLTDENDCSFRATGYGHLTNTSEGPGQFLRARSACQTDVNDPCCAPCSTKLEHCPDDPVCQSEPPAFHDKSNLGCFDQKRRFGVDLLYPTSRYVDALSKQQVVSEDGTLGPNRLLVSSKGVQRGKDRVFLTGIVGVPWQLIARNPADLTEGYQTATELLSEGTWNQILGDFEQGGRAADPRMIESIEPRAGLAGPSEGPNADGIVGHDYTVSEDGIGLLQHACIFDLPGGPIAAGSGGDCDAKDSTQNPLCQNPVTGEYDGKQYRAKAYPGLRQLAVLKGVQEQGVVASVCPAQLSREADRDYGYRPAMASLVERLKEKLGDLCLSRPLQANEDGRVSCIVIEGRSIEEGQSSCPELPGRSLNTGAHVQAVKQAQQSVAGQGLGCFYMVEQLEGEALDSCRQDASTQPMVDGTPIHGWCYVDPAQSPDAAASLVEQCPATKQQIVRFVGDPKSDDGGTLFIHCYEER